MQRLLLFIMLLIFAVGAKAQNKQGSGKDLLVIAYYSGDEKQLEQYPLEKLTHIIFSFCHLKGNRLHVDHARDTATIRALVAARKRNPSLKVMLSLGGWGGCEQCSPVFTTDANRKAFASSVKELCDYFDTDGIDLDWEYPAIAGHPGHPYSEEDRPNFTALIRSLRDTLGAKREISFAAGGLDNFLEHSVEWLKVSPLVDRINLMSYDLVNGFDTVTGHHTPLYPAGRQTASADHAIRYLEKLGVPLNKIVIGAAFYARTWVNVPDKNNGLYQPGKFKSFIPFRLFDEQLTKEKGFSFYFDKSAKAAYGYNRAKKEYATFDDAASVRLKTSYAISKQLNGIMFWELTLDKPAGGLLDVIDEVRRGSGH
jgi:chitinase